MFPNQNITGTTTQLDTNSSITSSRKSLKFDFNIGDFVVKDGKVESISGLEALKMWITKVLKTEKNKYKIYNNSNVEKYGINLLELVTSKYPISYIEAQIQNDIKETLLKNSDIKSIDNFNFKRDKRLLNVSFTVNTTYGTTESEVII